MMEIVVDAYGKEEQTSSWYYYIRQFGISISGKMHWQKIDFSF